MNKTKLIKRIKWKNIVKIFLFVILTILVFKLVIGIFTYISDNSRTKKSLEYFTNEIDVANLVDGKNTVIVNEKNIDKFNDQYEYIKQSLIRVNLDKLKKDNNDVIAWISIDSLDINSPILKKEEYSYLDFYKKKNHNGSLYSVKISKKIDKNIVISGTKTKYFLGKLRKFFSKEWKNDSGNFIIKFQTKNYTNLYKIVSVYKGSFEEVKSNFVDEEDFLDYVTNFLEKTEIDFDETVGKEDSLITIATNSRDEDIIVTGKLLKYKEF